MIDRSYSTEELAAHTGLPVPTVKYLVKHGVLRPSVQQAKGRGHANVFSFRDVLAARSLSCLQFDNALAKPLRKVAQFWASPDGEKLLMELKGRSKEDPDEPRVILVTDKGVKVDATPAQIMKDDNTSTVYCLDARQLYGHVLVRATEAYMVEFYPPGPSGRAPRRKVADKLVVKMKTRERGADRNRSAGRSREKDAPDGKAGRAR